MFVPPNKDDSASIGACFAMQALRTEALPHVGRELFYLSPMIFCVASPLVAGGVPQFAFSVAKPLHLRAFPGGRPPQMGGECCAEPDLIKDEGKGPASYAVAEMSGFAPCAYSSGQERAI